MVFLTTLIRISLIPHTMSFESKSLQPKQKERSLIRTYFDEMQIDCLRYDSDIQTHLHSQFFVYLIYLRRNKNTHLLKFRKIETLLRSLDSQNNFQEFLISQKFIYHQYTIYKCRSKKSMTKKSNFNITRILRSIHVV